MGIACFYGRSTGRKSGSSASATFADAVAAWRDYAEHTKRLKPASLRNYDAILSPPGPRPRHRGQRLARVMRAFGDRRLTEITTADIERFLRGLDREDLAARVGLVTGVVAVL